MVEATEVHGLGQDAEQPTGHTELGDPVELAGAGHQGEGAAAGKSHLEPRPVAAVLACGLAETDDDRHAGLPRRDVRRQTGLPAEGERAVGRVDEPRVPGVAARDGGVPRSARLPARDAP